METYYKTRKIKKISLGLVKFFRKNLNNKNMKIKVNIINPAHDLVLKIAKICRMKKVIHIHLYS